MTKLFLDRYIWMMRLLLEVIVREAAADGQTDVAKVGAGGPRYMIKRAIDKSQSLEFVYDGKKRVVEPFTMGIHKSTGERVMVAWLKRGFSHSGKNFRWRMYRVDQMSGLKMVKQNYRVNRPGYNPPDSRLSQVDADMLQKNKVATGQHKPTQADTHRFEFPNRPDGKKWTYKDPKTGETRQVIGKGNLIAAQPGQKLGAYKRGPEDDEEES